MLVPNPLTETQKTWHKSRVFPAFFTCVKSFCKYPLLGCIIFQLLKTDLKSAWNSAFLHTHLEKIVKQILGLLSTHRGIFFNLKMQVRKKWRNILKNFSLQTLFRILISNLLQMNLIKLLNLYTLVYTIQCIWIDADFYPFFTKKKINVRKLKAYSLYRNSFVPFTVLTIQMEQFLYGKGRRNVWFRLKTEP